MSDANHTAERKRTLKGRDLGLPPRFLLNPIYLAELTCQTEAAEWDRRAAEAKGGAYAAHCTERANAARAVLARIDAYFAVPANDTEAQQVAA